MVCLTLDQTSVSTVNSSSICQDNGSRSRKRMQQSSIGAAAAKQPSTGNKYSPFPSRGAPQAARGVVSGGAHTPRSLSLVPGGGLLSEICDSRPLQVVLPRQNPAPGVERCRPVFSSPAWPSPSSPTSPISSSTSSSSGSSINNNGDSIITHTTTTTTTAEDFIAERCHTPCPFVPFPLPPPDKDSHPSSSTTTSTPTQVYLYLYRHLPPVSSEVDYDRLAKSMQGLQAGCFYYRDLDSAGARSMLRKAPEGTFLVRNSSDPKYLFAVSVKTARGATSVRVQYYRGFFQLDCETHMKLKLPRFETMLDLLDFHRTMYTEGQGGQFRWQEGGRTPSSTSPQAARPPRKDMVIALTTPRRHSSPSLAHLARIGVNRCMQDLHLPHRSTDRLPVPDSLKQFLREYPFKV